jgi:hypothetical protein
MLLAAYQYDLQLSNINSCLCSWVMPLKSCVWYASIAEKQATYGFKVKWMNCSLVQIFVEWGHKTVNSHFWLAVERCTLQTGTVSLKSQRNCLPQHCVITKSVTVTERCSFHLTIQGCWKVLSPTRKETSYNDRRFWVSYILFGIIIGGIIVLFIYITRLASNKIF